MPEENAEKVLRAYKAWNRRDFDAALEGVDPEVDFAFVQFHASAREGLELDAPFVHLLWFRAGKVIRFRSYDDRPEALEAAGLSE
jgi:ketosteroid isomerase-like protein